VGAESEPGFVNGLARCSQLSPYRRRKVTQGGQLVFATLRGDAAFEDGQQPPEANSCSVGFGEQNCLEPTPVPS
jgi:hypothetical protein